MTSLPLPDGGGPALDPNAPVYGDPRIGRPQAPNFRGGSGNGPAMPGRPSRVGFGRTDHTGRPIGDGGFSGPSPGFGRTDYSGRPEGGGRPDWNNRPERGPGGAPAVPVAGGALGAAHQAWRDARPENPMRDWRDTRPDRSALGNGIDWRAKLEEWRATRPDMSAWRDRLQAWRDQRPGMPPTPQVGAPPPPAAPVPQVSAQPPGQMAPDYMNYGQGPGHRWR